MKIFYIIILIVFNFSPCAAMIDEVEMSDDIQPRRQIRVSRSQENVRLASPVGDSNLTLRDTPNVSQANATSPDLYIPQAVSLDDIMKRESKVCFLVARWILQPINVIAPCVTMVCSGVTEMYIKSNPQVAQNATTIGLAAAVVDFVCSVLTIKVNNKLQKNDDYLRRDRGENI